MLQQSGDEQFPVIPPAFFADAQKPDRLKKSLYVIKLYRGYAFIFLRSIFPEKCPDTLVIITGRVNGTKNLLIAAKIAYR